MGNQKVTRVVLAPMTALAEHKEDLQDTLAEHAFCRDLQTDRLARLQKRGAKLQARKAAQSA